MNSEGSFTVSVLDHGYVTLVESWGSDQSVIEAARMSTNKGFTGWGPKCPKCGAGSDSLTKGAIWDGWFCDPCDVEAKAGDEKLLKFLYENNHATPFEMGGVVIEVQAPIFVFREWHRHRTQSYNEMSARYTPLPDLNYIPTVERLLINSKTNKQAGTIAGASELTEEMAEDFRQCLQRSYAQQQELYEGALLNGVPKELARIHLPVARYSRMRAQANLRNWLGFLTLRMAPNAQYEIRVYAEAVASLVQKCFPKTYELFAEKK